SLDWWLLDKADHRGLQKLVADLNCVYKDTPALWEQDTSPEGFAWIDANDASGNVLSFLRFGRPEAAGDGADGDGATTPALACVANFSGSPHHGYRIGLPRPGTWREVLNTDAEGYGGSGAGNLGGVEAVEEPWHGQSYSATLAVPPLGTVWFVHE
ncbi:MAG TPA: alpha amylase C-terminal domain-containing protein, partial [Actinomycetes bacterium]|nr:alpha amylase C-terminal domain-containing protein [Actinomycetes bacterium]